jgi:dipeptidyl aminopeptidase/acylaminoacyl peptidase
MLRGRGLSLLAGGVLAASTLTGAARSATLRLGSSDRMTARNGLLAVGDSTGNEIDVIGASGRLRRLIRYADSPAWTSDGKRLAYVGSPAVGNPTLYVATAAGRDRRQLGIGFPVDSAIDGAVSWSPDGRRLAFDGGPGGEDHIYVVNADGSGLRQLTRGEDTTPAWSPDGRTIAFVRGVSTFEIYLMNADGSDPRKLTAGDSPAWSPHGTLLAFDRGGGAYSGDSGGLYVIQPGGGHAQRLGNGTAPVWSPDGRELAFFCCSGYADSRNGIFVVSVNGGRPRRLARFSAGPVSLSWQPLP